MQAAWYERLGEEKVRCGLCPHRCELVPGATGICRVRENRAGELILPAYALASSLALDPVEKKPLYRFLPGTLTFSVGFYGCNLRCPFCQNWEISQIAGTEGRRLAPGDLVALALESGAPSISFTYSEPTVHFEYVLEAAILAQSRGLKTILVTNGNLNRGPAAELLKVIDAVNLDIKCHSPEAYHTKLSGNLECVLEFAAIAARNSWLEVTTLVVPELDDWERAIDKIASFLKAISAELPLHISAYHPAYRYSQEATPSLLVHSLARRARVFLKHVYVGNVALDTSEERCESCSAVLVRRRGYQTLVHGLGGNPGWSPGDPPLAARAVCANCGHPQFFALDTSSRHGGAKSRA